MTMATTIPDLTDVRLGELPSQGEAKVDRSLRDNLPDDYVVLFQVGWILRREGEQAQDGETDFLIWHPNRGCLCVEVKGGGVSFDAATGEWFSIDRHGREHRIKNPISQALRAKYPSRRLLPAQQGDRLGRRHALAHLHHAHRRRSRLPFAQVRTRPATHLPPQAATRRRPPVHHRRRLPARPAHPNPPARPRQLTPVGPPSGVSSKASSASPPPSDGPTAAPCTCAPPRNPEPEQRAVYDALGVDPRPGGVRETIV